MYTHANMICKDPKINPEVCQVVAIRELSASRFEHFRTHLLEDQDFISEVAEDLHGADHDGTRCLLVLGEGYPYGILVNSEGFDYARYSGILPHARQMVDEHLDQMAGYCVKEGITHSGDGSWTISFDELYEHFGTEIKPNNGWGEMLLEKVKQQAEVDEIIATEDEFEIQYHLENCPECQQGGIGGAMSLMSLMGCNLLCVRLQNDAGDGARCFIPELDPATLSEDGKREFDDILSARVLMMRNDTITIQGVSSERIKLFSDVLCQNCTMEDYYKFVAPRSGEVRTPYHAITQDEIDIASAKHTLWRLDQPGGVRADFSHCDLFGLYLSGKDFNSAIFTGCRMRNCQAQEGEFCFADFSEAQIADCDFESATFEESIWHLAEVNKSSFKKVAMAGSNLNDAVFSSVNMDDAQLQNCNLTHTNFYDTYIEAANTCGCVYSQSEWEGLTDYGIHQ